MEESQLLPNLFRTEYRKIVSVLCYLFGIDNIEIAEDITSDTFLAATELWSLKGIPENPTAWLLYCSQKQNQKLPQTEYCFRTKAFRRNKTYRK